MTIGIPPAVVNRKGRLPARVQWLAAASLSLGVGAAVVVAQAGPPLTEARVRTLAREASRDARGDATELVLSLDQRVRRTWGDFESFPLSIVRTDELLVTVTPPYTGFRRSLVDMLRSARPIARAVWTNAVVVAITPMRLGAPDVEAVTLSRDEREVPALTSALRPMTFSDAAGAQGVIHAGDVQFGVPAFAPGARVVLTLRPRGREPIVYVFGDEELRSLR